MKTVKDFKDAGVVFVVGDEGNDFHISSPAGFNKYDTFDYDVVIEFAWRDLTTKPDNAKFSIEVDANNHRWRPSLNQDDNLLIAPPEFKAGDLVEAEHYATGKYLVKIKYIDTVSLFGYLQSGDNQPFCAYMKDITIKPYNPELDALKDIIGTHDDPTECAKAILAAGYTK